MRKRKKYLLDRHFQLGTAFSILGTILLAGVVVIATIGINMAVNNKRLSNIVVIHTNIVDTLLTHAQDPHGGMNADVMKNATLLNSQNAKTIERIVFRNNLMLLSLIIFMLLLGIVIFTLVIRMTHRISGPVHVMSGYMRDILQDRRPELRPLRKGDELQDFYALFREVVCTLQQGKGKSGARR